MKRNAFTLLEMSISMLILGLIGIGAFYISGAFFAVTESKMQNQKLSAIKTTLDGYSRDNKLYPCPADPTLAVNDPNFGLASADCFNSCPAGLSCTNEVAQGMVPFKTLGLSEAVVMRNESDFLIYGVDRNLTSQNCGLNGRIAVIDANGNSVTNNANFVLVDLGANANGAYTLNGKNICNSLYSDYENCDMDNVFLMTSIGDTKNVKAYDDTVVFSSNSYAPKCPYGVAGCKIWLDANKICTLSFSGGGASLSVSSWKNIADEAIQFTQSVSSDMPLYLSNAANAINGLPIVNFANDIISAANSNVFSSPNGFTVIAVIKTTSTDGALIVAADASGYTSTAGIALGLTTTLPGKSGVISMVVNGLPTLQGINSLNNGETHVISAVVQPASGIRMFADGKQELSYNGTLTIPTYNFVNIGSNQGMGYLNGAIPEIAVFPYAMTDTDRVIIEKGLAAKWAVTY